MLSAAYLGVMRSVRLDMKTAGRIAVVAICYLLSSYGILISLMLAGLSGIQSVSGALVGLIILFAWLCHVVMSMNWVLDKPATKWVPVYGTLAGILGLVLWPMVGSSIGNFDMEDMFHAAAMGIVFTLPCVLLAIYLVWFHLRAQSCRDSSSVS